MRSHGSTLPPQPASLKWARGRSRAPTVAARHFVRRGPARLRLRRGVAGPGAGVSEPPRPAIRWALYVFMCSIPFEAVPWGISATPSKVAGAVLIVLAALGQPGVCFKRRSGALVAFLAYVVVFGLLALPQLSTYPSEVLVHFSTLIQMLALFWLSENLLSFPRVAENAFLCFGLACILFAVTLLLGFGTTSVAYHDLTRVAGFNGSPNAQAAMLAFGIASLLGVALARGRSLGAWRLLLFPAFVVIAAAIVKTGSRSGLLALVVVVLIFMSFGKLPSARRAGMVLVLGLGLATTTLLLARSEVALSRWQATLERGEAAHRKRLFTEAWHMFLEAPILGWGPINNRHVLGDRSKDETGQEVCDPHNLALSILTECGVAGAVFFFAGLLLCASSAWRARVLGSILPLALTAALLVMCTGGVLQYQKLFWLILGYAVASGRTTQTAGFGKVRPGAPAAWRRPALYGQWASARFRDVRAT